MKQTPAIIPPLALLFLAASASAQNAPPAFEVASIHRTETRVNFERDGKTEISHGTLRMRDVTLSTAIHWAYRVQQSQILGPSSLSEERYDITAKANGEPDEQQMRVMLQSLLTERFRLSFHRDKKELRTFSLTTAKDGPKLRATSTDSAPRIYGIAKGLVAQSVTMRDLVEYLADPLETPLTDDTGIEGRYDFRLDFKPYLDPDRTEPPDPAAIVNAVLQGELGLKLVPRKAVVEVIVIDRFEVPSGN